MRAAGGNRSGMRTTLFFCVALTATVATADDAANDKNELVRSSGYFKVTAPAGHEAAANAALALARAVPPHMQPYFGTRGARGQLTIRLWPKGIRFRPPQDQPGSAWRSLGLALDRKTRTIHVSLAPASIRETSALGLRPHTRFAVAFGTALLSASPRAALWYADGASARAAARAVRMADTQTAVAQRFAAWRWLPPLRRLLAEDRAPKARAEHVTAGRAAFVRFLEEGPLADRLAAFRKRPRVRVQRLFPKNIDDLFQAWLKRQSMPWELAGSTLAQAANSWTLAADGTESAAAWRPATTKPPYSIRGTVTLAGDATVLLARHGQEHVTVSFRPGQGVTIARAGQIKKQLAVAPPHRCTLKPGQPVRFAVHVLPGQIAVTLRGIEVVTATLPKTGLTGAWGIATDSAARWTDLHGPGLTPPPAPKPRKDDGVSVATLTVRARKAKTAAARTTALTRLGRRGKKGWIALARIVRGGARKHPKLAVAAARALGADSLEPKTRQERTAMLFELHRRPYAPSVRFAILEGLLRDYPQPSTHAALLHEALRDASLDRRAQLFARLRDRLPPEVLRACLGEQPLAQLAYDELRRRDLTIPAAQLTLAAREAARQGHSLAYAQSVRDELARNRGWELVAAIARLVDDKEYAVRRGAYVLLLRVSGKDQPADADLWRSWVAARRGRYKRPDIMSPGIVAAAIVRGMDVLRADLLADGYCSYREDDRGAEDASTRTGATGLAVLALRAAGVPADDPAIRKALATTLVPDEAPDARKGKRKRGKSRRAARLHPSERDRNHTYAISILAMALASVDAKRHEWKLQELANMLAAGQLKNGQWTYRVGRGYEAKAGGVRPTGDNSNTQYALLGLRAASKAGAQVNADTWQRALDFWRKWQLVHGHWMYTPRVIPIDEHHRHTNLSMTAAGVSSVALCLEGLHGNEAARVVRHDKNLKKGLRALGRVLLDHGLRGRALDHYILYGVERACMLTGTRRFNEVDWYRQGALALIRTQRESGEWIHDGRSYGPAIDTAYALLFLRRATTPIVNRTDKGVVNVPPRNAGGGPR